MCVQKRVITSSKFSTATSPPLLWSPQVYKLLLSPHSLFTALFNPEVIAELKNSNNLPPEEQPTNKTANVVSQLRNGIAHAKCSIGIATLLPDLGELLGTACRPCVFFHATILLFKKWYEKHLLHIYECAKGICYAIFYIFKRLLKCDPTYQFLAEGMFSYTFLEDWKCLFR